VPPTTPPERAPRRGLSIRWTLFISFALFVAAGGSAAIWLAYRITTDAVIGESQRRASLDLRAAWAQYDRELDRVRATTQFAASGQKVLDLLSGSGNQSPEWTRQRLEAIRKQHRLDVLTVANPRGQIVLRAQAPYRTGDEVEPGPVLRRALANQAASGTVIVPSAALEREGQDLAERARVEIVKTPRASPTRQREQRDGMMLMAAEPVRDDRGRLVGIVYGGILLNRRYALTDTIRDILSHGERYRGRHLTTVTIFQGDLRIATNVLNRNGSRAIGTRLSRAVHDVTLRQGLGYHDRAFVVNDWYLTAYDPIRDPDGKIIGILYVGILEQKFLDYRRGLINATLVGMVIGIALALALALLLAVWLSRPIRALTRAAAEVAAGNFYARVEEGRDLLVEISTLKRVFNQMGDAVVRRGDDLTRINHDLQRSNGDLALLNQNYMDLLGFVTHELKSPLASLVFSLSSLKDGYFGDLTPKQRQLLDGMEKNVEYFHEVIQNYLNLSRIEKNELAFNPVPVRLREDVIEPVLAQVTSQLAMAQMHVVVEVPPETEVLGDADLLKIVLDNLLSNAAKYGRHGTEIRVTWRRLEDSWDQIRVHNEGPGIPPENIPRLFKKFSRLDIQELKAKKGTGLGLFITREIVQRHGGRIWAESEPEQGCDFIFELLATPEGKQRPV
jgi:two-component system NtrC family sensor kinase